MLYVLFKKFNLNFLKTLSNQRMEDTVIQITTLLGVLEHMCDHSALEAEAGELPWVWVHFGLHTKFKVNLNYIDCSYLNKQTNKQIIACKKEKEKKVLIH